MLIGNIVPANWFPITSAISLFEKNLDWLPRQNNEEKVFTVMNDRA